MALQHRALVVRILDWTTFKFKHSIHAMVWLLAMTSCNAYVRSKNLTWIVSHGAQMPLFSYPVVHKCRWGGAGKQTHGQEQFCTLNCWAGRAEVVWINNTRSKTPLCLTSLYHQCLFSWLVSTTYQDAMALLWTVSHVMTSTEGTDWKQCHECPLYDPIGFQWLPIWSPKTGTTSLPAIFLETTCICWWFLVVRVRPQGCSCIGALIRS